ncbi:MAG: DUF2442 domain-containing protein [Phycisphaerae bacterium]
MHRIIRVAIESGYVLRVWFESGQTGIFDVEPYLTGRVFEPLKDPTFFGQVQIDEIAGTVYWPNGADFCPDVIYEAAISGVSSSSRT